MRIKPIQLAILSSSLLLIVGCSVKANESKRVEIEKSIHVSKNKCLKKIGCEKKLITNLFKKVPLQQIIRYKVKPTIHHLKTIQGKSIRIIEQKNGFKFPQYSNKIVVLEFFGKNCHHCIKEIQSLNKLYKKYGKKLEVLSIQVEEPMGKSVGNKLIKKYKIKYPIIDGDESTNLQSFIKETYGWGGILPYTLVVKNGLTEFAYSGKVTYQEIQSDISSLM